MDNDQQVTDLVRRTRDQFLNQPLDPDDRIGDTFNLELEFAKTAKNRSFLVPIVVVAFLVVLGAAAYVANQLSDQKNKQATVKVGSFDDLKLKELFDSAKKNQRDLDDLNRQIDVLKSDLADKQNALKQNARGKMDLISLGNDPLSTKNQKLADVQKGLDASMAVVQADSNAKIKVLQAQMAEIQKKIDGYDNRIGNLNKQNQENLDAQQRVFQIEKNKITDFYENRIKNSDAEHAATVARLKSERDTYVKALIDKHNEEVRLLILKYNPVIDDPDTKALFASYENQAIVFTPAALPDRLTKDGLIKPDYHQVLQDKVAKARSLLTRLQAIPYSNGVPPLIHTIDDLLAEALNGYDGYLVPLAASMDDLDAQIAQLNDTVAQNKADAAAAADTAAKFQSRWTTSVSAYAATIKEDGVVVDASDPTDLLLVVKKDKAAALKPDQTAMVVDSANNQELGVVTLTVGDTYVAGAVVTLKNASKPIKAFDRLKILPPPKAK